MGRISNFGYRNVELKDSHWKQQRSGLIETYLKIDNDDLLHYFRAVAGIPDDSCGLVGWYGDNASTFGQKLGAFVRLYLETGDERLRKKAVALADGWGECARVSEAVLDVNSTYVYDKLMGGFLDMLEFLHYEPAKDYIRRLTESGDRRFDKTISRDGLQIMEPGMIEWYTLPEQLFRAWILTGEQLYLDFAKEWDYTYLWEKLKNHDFRIGPRHAYSQVNSLSSAAMAYQVTGDEGYLEAMKAAYDEILAHHTFATGGYGPAECIFPDEEGYLGDSIRPGWDTGKRHMQYRNFGDAICFRDDQWGSCEVSCCSWAVFKLCDYLLRFTGEAKYGDWAERMLYNCCGGQLPITDEGKVMYYADYFMNGAFKSVEDGRLHDNGASFEWQCCTGTFPEDVAEYSNMLYYFEKDTKDAQKDQPDCAGLYVSQYLASSVSFCVDGAEFTLENTSFFPKEKQLRFVISCREARSFPIRFRVPAWAAGTNSVCINGERQTERKPEPNTWLEIDRRWENGDCVELSFEFLLRFAPVDAYAPEIAALCYGPLTLVCNKMTVFEGDIERPQDWIEPVQKDGYSFAFRTKPGHVVPFPHLTREFYPYYEVPQMEWYYMYNRVKAENGRD